jgi:hypothetical protein
VDSSFFQGLDFNLVPRDDGKGPQCLLGIPGDAVNGAYLVAAAL